MSARAIRFGLRAAGSNLAAVGWRYVATLLKAFPVGLVVGALVDGYFSESLVAEQAAARIDPVLMMEFIFERGDALSMIGPWVLGALGLSIALSAFMTGAVLATVASDVPMRTNELFSAGGRGFGRLMRLFPFGFMFTAIVVGIPAAGLFKLHSKLTEDWVSEVGVLSTRLVVVAIALLIAAWVNGAYDLMKVEAVAKGEHRARYAFWRGLMTALKRPMALLAVYLPFVALALVITIVGSLIDVRITRSSALAIGLAIGIQQAVAIARAWMSVALAGAEVALLSREI